MNEQDKRENVINGLEMSYTYSNVDEDNTLVPQRLVLDVLTLLKAQEPVGPKKAKRYIDFDGEGQPYTPITYDCGACGKELPWKVNYCPMCGRKVYWV